MRKSAAIKGDLGKLETSETFYEFEEFIRNKIFNLAKLDYRITF